MRSCRTVLPTSTSTNETSRAGSVLHSSAHAYEPWGLGRLQPPPSRLGQSHYFFGQDAEAKFFGQKPAVSQKMKKMYLLNEKKPEFIPFSEIKYSKSGILLVITALQVSIAVFFRALSKKIFRQRCLSLLEKNWPVRVLSSSVGQLGLLRTCR